MQHQGSINRVKRIDSKTNKDDHTRLAIIAIVTATLALSLGDAIIKKTGVLLPLWQMFLLRSLLSLPVLAIVLYRKAGLKITAPGWILLRSLLLVTMWVSYYITIQSMPLSLAAAVYYTAPILIVLIASLLDRRAPPSRIWISVLLGFTGVLLILRPDSTEFSIHFLMPLIAAALYAAAMVMTSRKCRDNDPLVLTFVLNSTFVVVGSILGIWSTVEQTYLTGAWATLDLKLIAIVTVLALLNLTGNIGAAIAYQRGSPVTIATFDYSYVIFGLIWGILFFAEFPNLIAISGIILIIGAGILSLSANRKSQP